MTSRVALAALIAACSGGSSSAVDAPGNPGNCAMQISGAGVTGGYPCTVTAIFSSQTNRGSVGIHPSTVNGLLTVNLNVTWIGEPAPRAYHSSDADVTGGAKLMINSGASGMTWSTSPAGSYDLTLTSVMTASTSSTGKTYAVHGNFDATLVSDGPQAPVMVSGFF